MNARNYFQSIQQAINGTPFVVTSNIHFNEVDTNECYIRGTLIMSNGFELHIAEYTFTQPSMRRAKYRYHLQKHKGVLVKRWDNVPHHRHISTFPDHRHDEDESIHPSPPMDLFLVLQEIVPLVSTSNGH